MAIIKRFLLVSSLAGTGLASPRHFDSSHHDDKIEVRSPDTNVPASAQQTILLPWVATFSCSTRKTPSIRGIVAGRPFNFPIDTGSTGVLISSSLIPSIRLTRQNPTGWAFSEAGSILYNGQYADLDITFPAKRKEEAISRIPVLVVTRVEKCVGYNTEYGTGVCPKGKGIAQRMTVATMGIGFGQNVAGAGLPYATPAHNPLLNIRKLSKYSKLSIRRGYTVSTEGIYVGLTDKNTDKAKWVQLDRIPPTRFVDQDWVPPVASFDFKPTNNIFQASAVIDTGIAQMYVQSNPNIAEPNITTTNYMHSVRIGTRLSFLYPGFISGLAGYDMQGTSAGGKGGRGYGSKAAFVGPENAGSRAFASSGRNYMDRFTMVYDADNGKFGFITKIIQEA